MYSQQSNQYMDNNYPTPLSNYISSHHINNGYHSNNNISTRHSHLPSAPPPPPPHHQFHQQQQQIQQPFPRKSSQQPLNGYNNNNSNNNHNNNSNVPPPEPTPSTTESPTTPLSTSQIAEFAATMVHLMWHARRPSVMALHDISKLESNTQTDDRDINHSKETVNIANYTSAAFRKFCKQILTATQLSESVILLSLKYIAMLLQNNPTIQGAEGSEYRLFTVALMLGNKFLDDNTFTNKTWSEVSGMKVTDLNIMELEFLDVLRYTLFIRNDEFDRWKSALFLFRNQLQKADEIQKQEHQQQLIVETFKGIIPNVQPPSQPPHAEQNRLLLMLYKAQLPQYPTQPLNRPLARVPLRIPHHPVWSTQQQSNTAIPYDTQNRTTNTPNVMISQPSTTIAYHSKPLPTYAADHTYQAVYSSNPTYSNGSLYSSTRPTYSQPTATSRPATTSATSTAATSSVTTSTAQLQDYSASNNYFYNMTPSTTPKQPSSSTENSDYFNSIRNQSYAPPPPTVRPSRTSYYSDINPNSADYSSYDMNTSDYYSRMSATGNYVPSSQSSRQSMQGYYPRNSTTNNTDNIVPEDPFTVLDSYRSHLN
ncbi:hypothetical protein BDB01DRAFT_850439 [Pilobolus umbonatus]|nr:hypothetical protein BDB01DRAFT_850439 [Pilobolus umbonatus]